MDKIIANLKIEEVVTEHLIIMREGYNLGRFELIDGTYHYKANKNLPNECYSHRFIDIDTKATTLLDAINFISYERNDV